MTARRRLPALTAIVALVLGLLTVLAPPPASADTTALSVGTVHWGIKKSWRTYIADGVFPSDGATRAADGAFDFPVVGGSFDDATRALTLELGGKVRFAQYCADMTTWSGCQLDSTFSNLRLVLSADVQEIRGDYDGISRATPGGAIEHFGDIALVTVNALDAQPLVNGGRTEWPELPTVAAAEFPLYPAGTLMDPVSFSYDGPGGAPDLGEHWSPQGVPVFTADGMWVPSADSTSRNLLAGTNALHVVERRTTTATAVTITALDPTSLAVLATTELAVAKNASYFVAIDRAQDRLFVATRVPTTRDGVRGGDVTITEVVRDGGGYRTGIVGKVEQIASSVSGLTWNPVADELALITSAGGKGADRFTFTRLRDGELTQFPVALPSDASADQIKSSLLGGGSSPVSRDLAAARDGSYVAVGATARGAAVPARHLIVGENRVTTTFVADSTPTVQPYAQDYSMYIPYGRATPASDGSLLLSAANWTGVVAYLDIVDGRATMVAGDVPAGGEDAQEGAGSDATRGLDYVLSSTAAAVKVFRDHEFRATLPVANYVDGEVFAVLDDGALVVPVKDPATGRRALQRWGLTEMSPVVSAHPADRTVELPAGTTGTAIAFTAAGTGGIQWQIRPAGASRFTDLPGENSPVLALIATLNTAGTEVRAVFSNEAGRVATDVATVTVRSAPIIEAQPTDVTVYEGQPFSFSVLAVGDPAPELTWQRRDGARWVDVTEGVEGAQLTVPAATLTDDGAVFRARLSNAVGTVFSAEARATVRQRPAVPTTTTYTGVALEWAGSPEWQHRPPNGSAAHYLSAGVSDGTPATYRATSPGVEILQRTADGASTPASWDTRGAHVDAGGEQIMRLTDGTAIIEADGSATISWRGSVSVNFYDGLVPFTMTDPVLIVAADGRGALRADLAGYAGDMSNPDKPKERVEPRSGVTIATFGGTVVDAERGFVVTPDYDGVRIDPRGGTAQLTSGTGWGSWPQPFIDFHSTTHLAAYFYTTGGSLDAAKRPSAMGVGFAGARIPQVPTTPELPVAAPVITPTDVTAVTAAREGLLLWGVKQSFRSYITGGIAKGAISVSRGASTEGGLFRFGQTATDWSADKETGTTSYGGAVSFTGHSGILDLTFADPQVRIDSPTAGTLLVAVNGATVPIGAIDLAAARRSAFDGGVAYADAPVSLTADGVRVFSYGSSQFYALGTVMDPVTFVVGGTAAPAPASAKGVAAYASTEWKAPATPPATSGLTIAAEQLAELRPGSELTAVGSGFAPGESGIRVVLYSDPVVLEKELTADASGVATWTGRVPLDTHPGEHTLTFQGTANLGAVVTVQEPAPLTGCAVEGATLDWGFKESFRSYISGSIAHGEWTVIDGATYATPRFGWNAGTGRFDSETFAGRISFPGTVRFTGHDGLLDTTVGAPTLVIDGRDTAHLLLNVTGLTMDDALAGRTDNVLVFDQIPFAEVDLSSATVDLSEDGRLLTVTDAPTAITSQGFTAFPNYEVGTAFDPLSFTVPITADCGVVAAVSGRDIPVTTQIAGVPAIAGDDLGGIRTVGVALLFGALGALVTVLIMRRRRGAGHPVVDEGIEQPTEGLL